MSDLYRAFARRCARNMLVGTMLSVAPAGAFYFFVFPYEPRQLAILSFLGLLTLAALFPFDLAILRWTLRPVRHAFSPTATDEDVSRGLVRLLDSPRLVLLRVFGPHAVSASALLTVLVLLANRWLDLGVSSRTFPLYWFLNLTVIPVAHVVYEFTAMERDTQPLASVLARRAVYAESLVPRFTLEQRMRIFFPLLCLAPLVIIFVSLALRGGAAGGTMLRDIAAIAAACAALFLYLMYVLGGQIRRQTAEIIGSLDRIARGDLQTRVELYATSEFGQVAAHVNSMASALSDRQRLRDLFGAYMSDEVAAMLLAQGGVSEKRHVAIMFVDVRGFTAFSRNRSPEVVVGVLNRFFEQAVEAIAAERGTVNKYLGDGLLAVFGAPVALRSPEDAAVRAGLEVARRVRALNHLFAATAVPALRIGVGIHAGEVVVGSIGSPRHKLEYTVIGDAVNIASRVEQLTKQLGCDILATAEVAAALSPELRAHLGPFTAVDIKGVETPLRVCEVSTAGSAARRGGAE